MSVCPFCHKTYWSNHHQTWSLCGPWGHRPRSQGSNFTFFQQFREICQNFVAFGRRDSNNKTRLMSSNIVAKHMAIMINIVAAAYFLLYWCLNRSCNFIHHLLSVMIIITSLHINIADMCGHFNVMFEFHYVCHRRKGMTFSDIEWIFTPRPLRPKGYCRCLRLCLCLSVRLSVDSCLSAR